MEKDIKGFTLIELITVIVLLSIIAGIATMKYIDIAEDSKYEATKSEMINLKKAISGYSDGNVFYPGYEGDVGSLPPNLQALVTKPASVPAYDKIKKIGWNGPYINDDGSGSYLKDAWGNNYIYDAANRVLKSPGKGTPIIVKF